MDPWQPHLEQFNPQAYARGDETARLHQLMLRQLGGPGYAGALQNAPQEDFDAYMAALKQVYGTSRPQATDMVPTGTFGVIPQPSWDPYQPPGGGFMGAVGQGLQHMAGQPHSGGSPTHGLVNQAFKR